MRNTAKVLYKGLWLLMGLFFLSGNVIAQTDSVRDSSDIFSQLQRRLQEKRAVSQNANPDITLNVERVSLSKALKLITEQAEAGLYYDASLMPDKKVTLHLKDVPLSKALQKALAGTSLKYTTSGRNITLQKRKSIPPKLTMAAVQETVSGTVTDAETGNTLPGVNILVKGTSNGTATDNKGHYSLDVSSLQDTLRFSYIGYETKTVPINGQATINVTMKPTTISSGNQLVVVGYGTEKEKNLTGAVSQVGDEVFKHKTSPDVARSLEGQIPGVYINEPTGSPKQSFSPVIRGKGSIGAGGRALVLIDGVPGSLDRVNPHDIKSISVEKDASSAAIYGSRAAFGVIQVTTKQAKEGEVQIHYSSSYSLNDRAVKPHLLTNGYLWAKNFSDSYYNYIGTFPTTVNTGLSFSQEYLHELKKRQTHPSLPKVAVDPSSGKYVYYGSSDWQKQLYADYDPSMDQNISISGGSDKANFYLSGRYFYQHGIYRHSPDKFKRYNLRAKGNLQAFPWLKISDNFAFSRRNYFFPRSQHNSGVNINRRIADEYSPIAMLRNPDGTFTKNAAISFESFIVGHNFQTYTWQQLRNTASLVATFFDNHLDIHGDISYKFVPYLYNAQRYPVTYSDRPGHFIENETANNWASQTTHRTDAIRTNIYADYKQSFGKHNFKAKVGYEYENTDRDDRTYKRYGLLNPNLSNPDLITGEDYSLTGGGYEWTTSGGFFRLNYNYAERYLVEVNGRYDGSSKFPTGQQFGFFPSISAGWHISNEPYWKVPNSIISNLKIRGSFGSLGNGAVSPYSFLETMSVTKLDRLLDGTIPQITHRPNVIPNGLTWERVTTANIGLDAGFLDNRLSLTFDKYTRYTTGMFTQGLPLPGVFGTSVPKGNYANMKTPGWELSVSLQNHTKSADALQYKIKLSLYDNHSIITKFNNPQGLIFSHYKGEQLGEIWGFETDGLYQSQKEIVNEAPDQSRFPATVHKRNDIEPGDLKFVDQNGDGKITDGDQTLGDHGDLKRIGNKQPRYLFGVHGNFEWHHFDLSVFFQGVGKKDWWPSHDASFFWGQYNRPYTFEPIDVYKNQWTPDNKDAYFPRLVGYSALGYRSKELNVPSTRYLQNVAYVRLKHLSIGYNLPRSLISKVGLRDAQVYLSGENLWVWSPMFKVTKAIDPQAITSHGSNTSSYISGTDVASQTDVYPILRTISFGINLTF
jgi:TonB-linked SusC/RagA family outer membrane protein